MVTVLAFYVKWHKDNNDKNLFRNHLKPTYFPESEDEPVGQLTGFRRVAVLPGERLGCTDEAINYTSCGRYTFHLHTSIHSAFPSVYNCSLLFP